eukprot:202608-Pyramimonas_sp.AAC.1
MALWQADSSRRRWFGSASSVLSIGQASQQQSRSTLTLTTMGDRQQAPTPKPSLTCLRRPTLCMLRSLTTW